MDTEYWYRCNQCGYMYTPQQVLALIQLQASRASEGGGSPGSTAPPAPPTTVESASEAMGTQTIVCRKRGCDGIVLRTESVFREGR